jgi:hypothetical protein
MQAVMMRGGWRGVSCGRGVHGEEGRDGTGLWAGWPRPQAIASKVEGVLIGLFASCILYSNPVHLHTSHPDLRKTPTTKNLHIYAMKSSNTYSYVWFLLYSLTQTIAHMEIYNTFTSIRNYNIKIIYW